MSAGLSSYHNLHEASDSSRYRSRPRKYDLDTPITPSRKPGIVTRIEHKDPSVLCPATCRYVCESSNWPVDLMNPLHSNRRHVGGNRDEAISAAGLTALDNLARASSSGFTSVGHGARVIIETRTDADFCSSDPPRHYNIARLIDVLSAPMADPNPQQPTIGPWFFGPIAETPAASATFTVYTRGEAYCYLARLLPTTITSTRDANQAWLWWQYLLWGEDMTCRMIINLEVIAPGSLDRLGPATMESRTLAANLTHWAEAACPATTSGSHQYCDCRAMIPRWRSTWSKAINSALNVHDIPATTEMEEELRWLEEEPGYA